MSDYLVRKNQTRGVSRSWPELESYATFTLTKRAAVETVDETQKYDRLRLVKRTVSYGVHCERISLSEAKALCRGPLQLRLQWKILLIVKITSFNEF